MNIFTWNGTRPLIVPKGSTIFIAEGTRVQRVTPPKPAALAVPNDCRVINKQMLTEAWDKVFNEKKIGGYGALQYVMLELFGEEPS